MRGKEAAHSNVRAMYCSSDAILVKSDATRRPCTTTRPRLSATRCQGFLREMVIGKNTSSGILALDSSFTRLTLKTHLSSVISANACTSSFVKTREVVIVSPTLIERNTMLTDRDYF